MTKERTQVPMEDRWNVEAMYPTLEEWEKDLKVWAREGKKPHWPEIAAFKGRLAQGPEVLAEMLKVTFNFDRHLAKIYTYAHLRHDEDVANTTYKNAHARITALLNDFRQETAWIEPEILTLPESFIKADVVKEYRIHLEKIVRLKPHTLSGEKEELVALAGKALEASERAYSAFNNADLKFPKVKDSQGMERELTTGMYYLHIRDHDRKLRENAFKTYHKGFEAYENTLCELINGQIQKHVFDAKARGYKSCLEAALFPHQIDPQVYMSLIQSVRTRLPSLHNYMKVRKKLLGVDQLHLYDMYVPLVPNVDIKMNYPEGERLVIDAVEQLGSEYKSKLDKGLTTERWVDRYENLRKRSGAYSSGCYDSRPYILMNYHGIFNDVMTLAHEAGHSMHSLYSCEQQPYQYSQYPIFVAEVASTFNEELLRRYLFPQIDQPEKKRYLINQQIEDIRGTFFRQTMFAEFELRLHQWAEEGEPLTPALLKETYRKLNVDYFGPDVVIDEEVDIEWARIPHFYYNFYVYQYATGISAALALVENLLREGEPARQGYLKFISSGCSKPPLELLKIAGVDMTQPEPINAMIDCFDNLVEKLSNHEPVCSCN